MTIAATLKQAAADDGTARRLAEQASAAAGIRVLEAHDAASCRRVGAVLDRIWGRDVPMLDPGLLVALAHSENFVALAEDEAGNTVGAAVGFCGPAGTPFHSHIVGLLPGTVGHGAGRAIKLAQRAWCLERGIGLMTWTYDPLIARNAHFNLRRLGAKAVRYLPDHYGVMTDKINAGQHSDRILISWDLEAELPSPDASRAALELPTHAAVAEKGETPTDYSPPPASAQLATIAIPADIEALRRSAARLAGRWRAQTRLAFTELLDNGWRIVDFALQEPGGGAYVLEREATR